MVKRLFIFNMRLTIKIRKPAVLAVVAGGERRKTFEKWAFRRVCSQLSL